MTKCCLTCRHGRTEYSQIMEPPEVWCRKSKEYRFYSDQCVHYKPEKKEKMKCRNR